ncbi:hypothetical protein TNCV_4679371 [Trichonephila clavipes]|nr:hypothetical protein TNCV_4679371 [Trichonephila clavipes]
MDLSSGYWQIEVDEADREKTALIPPEDLRRPHLQRLRSVLKCIQDAGLALNPKKCVFCSRQIKILEHLVSEEGIIPDPGKVRTVQNFPVPKNMRNVRRFFGLCSYYCRFIKDFCLKAQPLQELLKNESKFTWGSDQNESFEKLKTALTSEPVLGLFDEKASHRAACRCKRLRSRCRVSSDTIGKRKSDGLCFSNPDEGREELFDD